MPSPKKLAHLRYPENACSAPTWLKYEIFTFVPAAGGGGAGQLTKNISKKCDTSIALSANVQHNIKEAQKWEQAAAGMIDKIAAGVGAAKSLVQGSDTFLGGLKSGATAVGNELGTAAKGVVGGTGLTGEAIVDKMALKYDGPEGRTFSTTHKFVAKSKEESVKIDEIIKILRIASAPSLSGGVLGGKASLVKTSYKFPDLFKVTWMTDSKPDPYFPQYDTCYCKSIDVKYGDGSGVTFDGTTAPLIYELTMEFEEMAFATKESIREGG
jgi:hypothetical protein